MAISSTQINLPISCIEPPLSVQNPTPYTQKIFDIFTSILLVSAALLCLPVTLTLVAIGAILLITDSPDGPLQKTSSTTHSIGQTTITPLKPPPPPPIKGIKNRHANCCFNVLVQMFHHIPDYGNAFKSINGFKKALENYEKALLSKTTASLEDDYCAELRRLFSHGIASHEDPSEILALAAGKVSDSNQISHTVACTDSTGQVLSAQTHCFIPLGPTPDPQKRTLIHGLKEHLNQVPHDNYAGRPLKFSGDCKHLLISNESLTDHFQGNVLDLFLDSSFFDEKNREASYRCDFYITFLAGCKPQQVPHPKGGSFSVGVAGGHYVCGVKINGQWFKMNDTQVYPITVKQAECEIRRARMIHYAEIT